MTMTTRGTEFPVTLTRVPLKLRAMQWTGVNEKAIQDELAGQAFQAVVQCPDDQKCDNCLDHPEITGELRNDFRDGEMQGMETGWWVCMTEEGKLFPAPQDVVSVNYIVE